MAQMVVEWFISLKKDSPECQGSGSCCKPREFVASSFGQGLCEMLRACGIYT